MIGIVVIGRNEGDRLRLCLESVLRASSQIVYVDSGSTDDSVALGRRLGVTVVELDMTRPFTAARARNEGFRRLTAVGTPPRYVFFVDGDCEVVDGWIEKAARFLDEHPDVAVACGRRRERYPDKSVYNLLCDIEWETAIGETKACGGDALMRVTAFQQAGGYCASLICGEEPELCVRLRKVQWRIWRLDEEMTLHDAGLYRFHQWWTRMRRAGYAYAQGAHLHGAPPERHWVSESRRAWIWGLGIPVAVITCAFALRLWALPLLTVYPLQVVRLASRGHRPARESWWNATALVIGKFPEMLGQIKFLLDRARGAQSRLIEYK